MSQPAVSRGRVRHHLGTLRYKDNGKSSAELKEHGLNKVRLYVSLKTLLKLSFSSLKAPPRTLLSVLGGRVGAKIVTNRLRLLIICFVQFYENDSTKSGSALESKCNVRATCIHYM